MLHPRIPAVATLLSVIALSAVSAPAQAHGDRDGGRDGGREHHGHASGHGHSRGIGMTLTEDVTAILDTASVEVEGSNGARVGRDDDDLIVISVGGRHRGQWDHGDDDGDRDSRRGGSGASQAVVTFAGSAVTSEWTGFAFDYSDGTVTADVDGVEDVPVLTVVRSDDDDEDGDDDGWSRLGGHGGWGSSAELQLTEESADALDAVVGSDAFDAGDVFATTSRCGR